MTEREAAPVFGRRDPDDVDMTPYAFQLVGYRVSDNSEVVYDFHAQAAIPAGVGLDMASQITNGEIPTKAVADFLQAVIVPEDLDLWYDALYDEEVIVDSESLSEVFQWLNTTYGAGRPTRRSSTSGGGRSQTGSPSRAVRRAKGSGRSTTSSSR